MGTPRAVKTIKIVTHTSRSTKYELQDGEYFLETLLADEKKTEKLMEDVDILVFDRYL